MNNISKLVNAVFPLKTRKIMFCYTYTMRQGANLSTVGHGRIPGTVTGNLTEDTFLHFEKEVAITLENAHPGCEAKVIGNNIIWLEA